MNKRFSMALLMGAALFLGNIAAQPTRATADIWVNPARMYSVSHTGGVLVKTGDTVEVTLKAAPGGKATFDLGSSVQGLPMTETRPGTYVGKYQLVPRLFIHQKVWITAHLSKGGTTGDLIDVQPIALEP